LNNVPFLRIEPFDAANEFFDSVNVYYLEWTNALIARRPEPVVSFDLAQRVMATKQVG